MATQSTITNYCDGKKMQHLLNVSKKYFLIVALVYAALISLKNAHAQPIQDLKQSSLLLSNFKFHTGENFSELRINYLTIGNPSNPPVLVLHGTAGSAKSMMGPAFAGELFGAGQPLDSTKYFIIIPDAIGVGGSTKPSDGLKAKFPRYNYEDMVNAQHRLVTEGLGLSHLRLIVGNSMGGMQTWLWGVKYPGFADILVPMASTPTEMSGRNWITRRLIIDSIRNDPEWMNGNYTTQPKSAQFANVFFGFATSGGSQAIQRVAPTAEKADQLLNARLNEKLPIDTNDFLYQWESSHDFNVTEGLEKITATVLAINSADDERNPIALNIMEKELKRIPHAKLYLIPASDQTTGHGTTSQAKWWKQELLPVLATAPHIR